MIDALITTLGSDDNHWAKFPVLPLARDLISIKGKAHKIEHVLWKERGDKPGQFVPMICCKEIK